MNFPLRFPSIRVSQPLGDFLVAAIPAHILRQVTFLDPTRVESVNKRSFMYNLLGNQRDASLPRAREIAKYINTVESAFPNSIILAANYINYGDLQEDPALRWRTEVDGSAQYLVIPSIQPMASVIDGQHRLLGFDFCKPERKDMELLCAVYMDLPQVYQAYLFATININQRKVDKSLAYEQFGYNLDEEPVSSWSPDKLAVYFTRKLNLDPKSPLHRHIKIAPLEADLIFPDSDCRWIVSTACIVEGIISLISSKPKADRDLLHAKQGGDRNREILPDDASPFRELYKASKDDIIWGHVLNYFSIVSSLLWSHATERSYICKTIGLQGLFDVLKFVAQKTELENLQSVLTSVIESSVTVDFAGEFFQASGRGRVRVKNVILFNAGEISREHLPVGDRHLYLSICQNISR